MKTYNLVIVYSMDASAAFRDAAKQKDGQHMLSLARDEDFPGTLYTGDTGEGSDAAYERLVGRAWADGWSPYGVIAALYIGETLINVEEH